MNRDTLLTILPPFENNRVLIKKRQSVADIMRLTLQAHDDFAKDYDLIASRFMRGSNVDTLRAIFHFLKEEIDYVEETERAQIIKSPAAILETGHCDCKCYSLFVGGILDALNRQGGRFDWNYAYASYNRGVHTPGHVFVQCRVNGVEYWVDPVLETFNQRNPIPKYTIRKQKDNTGMALYTLSGTGKVGEVITQPDNSPTLKFNLVEWAQKNPALAVGATAALVFLLTRKKRRR